jgi:hypothetical protein
MNSHDFRPPDAYRSHGAAAPTTPAVCPACRSSSITTTARNPDENAYWRCGGCGEIWNAVRRGSEPSGGHRWR